jgi:transglutaminase-like putative cysteine protease
MKYAITHATTYRYDNPVLLDPHILRLQPRTDGFHHLQQYAAQVAPTPLGQTTLLDAEGNLLTRCWWGDEPINHLEIIVTSRVETLCDNPFNYLLEPWATKLPIDYPTALMGHLSPYLSADRLGSLVADPVASQLAQDIAHKSNWNTVSFLTELTQLINQQLGYQVRESGDPMPPSITWSQKSGSCRDFVMLFMAVCRAVGLAARFVSGYEAGNPDYEQMLHAWAEVYLPGAGWRGYDPTMGIAVCDRHVAIAASGWPRYAAPVTGTHRGGNGSSAILQNKVTIESV